MRKRQPMDFESITGIAASGAALFRVSGPWPRALPVSCIVACTGIVTTWLIKMTDGIRIFLPQKFFIMNRYALRAGDTVAFTTAEIENESGSVNLFAPGLRAKRTRKRKSTKRPASEVQPRRPRRSRN